MIVKNEQDTLARCLRSAESFVDEIIIVDTGSTDRTKEVAAEFTDKVYDFEWIDDFSAARNFSFEHAQMDFILWLDADDIILPEDALKFKQLKETLTLDVDAVMLRYNTGFDDSGRVTFSCFRERLSRRSGHFQWKEPVHEYLETSWKRITADACVTHAKPHGRQSDRNIEIYEACLSAGKELSPRGMYYYARELKDHERYADAIQWFRLFLDSEKGWIEDNITACSELAKCHMAKNEPEQALQYMLQSFRYDTPRAETCCQIGYFFKTQANFAQAVFWFELALKLEKRKDAFGFRQEDCWGFIPCLELAVCYDKLGDYSKAVQYNDRAETYKPDSPFVQFNKNYFKSRLESQL